MLTAAEIGIFLYHFFKTVLGYYCLFLIFGKVYFTSVIIPNLFLGLIGTNFIVVIFFFGKMVEYSLWILGGGLGCGLGDHSSDICSGPHA
jgi:hypothetical protein